jgi:hypothetical protein
LGASWFGGGLRGDQRDSTNQRTPPNRNRTAQYRWNIFRNIRNAIDQNEGGLEKFTQGGFDRGLTGVLTGAVEPARGSLLRASPPAQRHNRAKRKASL